jgi:hypothetical protein
MSNIKLQNLVRSALMLAIAIMFQIIGKNIPAISQSFVGPAVNSVLIITEFLCGTTLALLVGAMIPLLAWFTGQLNTAMGFFIPFIMLGNIIYVVSFGMIRKRIKNSNAIMLYLSLIIAATLKYLFLFFSASKMIGLLKLAIPVKLAEKLIIMMGIPQLITALIGGFIGIVIVKKFIKNELSHD